MKFKTTWALIALFAALGAYLVFVEEPRHRSEGAAKERLALPNFDPGRVTELALEGPRGRGLVVRGAKGEWTMKEPLEDRADDGRVRGLLDDLKALTVDREVAPAGADLKPFGLTEPDLVIQTQGARVTLAIGAENPSAEGRYLRVGDGPVQMTRAHLVSGLLQEPRDLRSKDVLPSFPWNRLRSVSVDAPGAPALKLSKTDAGWRVLSPVQAEADPDVSEVLAEKLRWAKASSFLDETADQAAPRFEKAVTVTLDAEGEPNPSVVRLAVVGKEVWVAAGTRRALFTLPRDVVDAFQVKAETLRRKKPVFTKTWSAEALELTAPAGTKLTYAKQEGAWRRGSRVVGGEESARLQELLQFLEETTAIRILSSPEAPGSYGLDRPRFTLTLSDSQQGRQTLVVGEKAGAVFARAASAGPVYEMPAEYRTRIASLERAASPATGGGEKRP